MVTDTKTALLDSAERAARSRGFDGFSYADLSNDVGIRKASIHYHFPTKADLALALMQRYRLNFQNVCEQIEKTEQSGARRLEAVIGNYRDALNGGNTLCLCVSLSASRDSLPAGVIDEIQAFRQEMITWLCRAFQIAKEDESIVGIYHPQAEAAAALSLFEGAHLAARAEENPDLFEKAIWLLQHRIKTPSQ
ncbi:MAG: TetR/AcrR family transcriptional regulator [Pseudoruegeria sp.]